MASVFLGRPLSPSTPESRPLRVRECGRRQWPPTHLPQPTETWKKLTLNLGGSLQHFGGM